MQTFTQVTNQENDLNSIERAYQDRFAHDFWLADALQKDAIQNSWDARISRKGEDWDCIFSYIDSDCDILIISDNGTSGLVGNEFSNTKEMIELLKSPENENLARFLNSNWSVKDSLAGGKWGRGKNIFLISSHEREFYFDSYRSSDSRYIFGRVYLDNEEKLIKYSLSWDNEARYELASRFAELGLLDKHGTRIIIPHPKEEIVDAIVKNKMIEFIGNSRWEIINKFDAGIFVKYDGKTQKVESPSWYKEELELKKDLNKVYAPDTIKVGSGMRTKKLVLAYDPTGDLPDNIKGIAVQRGGMTIERIRSKELLNIEEAENIYGWVELDKDLEKGMYDLENVEHTGFTWQNNPAKCLKDYLKRQLKEFAQEHKLLEDEREEINVSRRTAEEKALKNLVPLFKKLELSRNGHSSGGIIKTNRNRNPDEPLRLSAISFSLPRTDDRRINVNEYINNAFVIPINDTDKKIEVIVRTFIVSEDGKFSKVIEERKFVLNPGHGQQIGTDKMQIDNSYKKGKYYFRAKLLCLEDTEIPLPDNSKIEKGYEYDRINIPFYVEEDPPVLGNLPFQFSEITNRKSHTFLFEWEAQSGLYTIYYNGLHPKVQEIKKEDDANKNSESLTKFLTENAALIAYQVRLEEVILGEIKTDKEMSSLVESRDLTQVAGYLINGYSEFMWEYLGGK